MPNVLNLLASGNFITVNKTVIKIFGLHEAILLGCLCSKQEYWLNRKECEDGYFFCTAEQFEEETTLSPFQQRTAFKNLEEKGVIKTHIKGIPAKKYFKVNEHVLRNMLLFDGKEDEIEDTTASSTESNKETVDNTYTSEIKEVIDYINDKTGSKYRYNSESNNKHIRARLKDGYTVENLKEVIDTKSQDKWFADNNYLRPQTLFGSKFECYLKGKP